MPSSLLISLHSVLVSPEEKSRWISHMSAAAQFDQVLNADEQRSRTPQGTLFVHECI